MYKKITSLVVMLLILLIPNNTLAYKDKTIIFFLDEISLNRIEDLSLDNYSLGLVNLKTRPPYDEANLYLSINTGRKLGEKDYNGPSENLVYLGDVFITSSIGSDIENLLISDKNGKVDYTEEEIKYNYKWLEGNIDILLDKSDLLLISYDLQDKEDRLSLLKGLIKGYNQYNIYILPKEVAKEDRRFINPYLVPIININGHKSGLLTSKSTRRKGLIALEDISYDLKNTQGYSDDNLIGTRFILSEDKNPIGSIKSLYGESLNLLIIAYIFHGLIYLTQGLIGLWIIWKKKWKENYLFLYGFATANILTSLILGLFNFHRYIPVYVIINLGISYWLTRFIIKRGINIGKTLSITTYITIVLGTCIYPKLIYNSFIGFNNLVYGARYYGLNNGIMGVLLITSTLTIFYLKRSSINNILKMVLSLIILLTNFIVLSANLGANTGGFITSIVLFGLITYIYFLSKIPNKVKIIITLAFGLGIFYINILCNNIIGEKTHVLAFFKRIKANGIHELTSMAYYKLMELLKLMITPPFTLVILIQLLILKKLKEKIQKIKGLKREMMIVIITSLIGLILNDTGVINFIYMIHYLILYIITHDLDRNRDSLKI